MSSEVDIVGAAVTRSAGLGGAGISGSAVWRFRLARCAYASERSRRRCRRISRVRRSVPYLRAGDRMELYMPDAYPTIHRWVRPLIVDLAGRDPSLFRACMRLEELLEGHRLAMQSARGSEAAIIEGEGNLRRIEEGLADPN